MSSGWLAPSTVVADDGLPAQPRPPRVKVLHVITKFWAGAGGNTLLTAIGMDPARYEVWVAGCEGGPLWERAEAGGVHTVKLSGFKETISPVADLLVLLQLLRLIRRERFAIVHTHSAKGGFLGRLAAWLCRTPVVIYTFHGFSYHDFMSPWKRSLYLHLERFTRSMTHRFFAVAPRVAREAVEMRLARPGAITVVPSAIELGDIPSMPDPELRDEIGIPKGVPVVGTVGRLDVQKAPLDFVRMAAAVAARRPDTRFVMVGDGALQQEAEREAASLGVDVTFLGFRRDAPRIAASFDVFVISSLYEGLGRALTEALASARPVAATSVNGVPDLVVPGSTGLLAPAGEPGKLADCVTWLLDHPGEARRMGEQGRERVRSLFEPARMCGLIQSAYESLLGLPSDDPRDTAAAVASHRSVESASPSHGTDPASVSFEVQAGPPAPNHPPVAADARVLNWRLLTTDEPAGMLLLPVDGERLPAAVTPERTRRSLSRALADGPYPAVAVPDLGSWAALAGTMGGRRLLAGLSNCVAEGGWLYAGFSNVLFPGHPLESGSLERRSAERILARAGLAQIQAYLPFPSQRLPAYLVSMSAEGNELDYFLRYLAFPHVDGAIGWRHRVRRLEASVMHRAAVAAPRSLRAELAPSFALFARRSA